MHVQQWLNENDLCAHVEAEKQAQELIRGLATTAQKLFLRGQQLCSEANLLLMDTKYEFGLDEKGQLMLVDEIHTPDASRFVDLKAFEQGRIEHYSKEWLREEVQAALSKRTSSAVQSDNNLPFVLNSIWADSNFTHALAQGTAQRYQLLFERLFPQMKPWDLVAPHLIPWPVDPGQMRRKMKLSSGFLQGCLWSAVVAATTLSLNCSSVSLKWMWCIAGRGAKAGTGRKNSAWAH